MLRRSILALTSAAALAGCALPKSEQLPSSAQLLDSNAARMEHDAGIAVERVRVPRNSFKPNRIANPLPPALRSKPIDVRFSAGGTLGDLVQTLSASDIQVAFEFNEIIDNNIQVGGTGTGGAGGSGGRPFGNGFGSGGFGSNSGFGANGLNGYGSNGLTQTSSSTGFYGGSGGYGSSGLGYGSSGYGSGYGNSGSGSGYGGYGSNSYGGNGAFGGLGAGGAGNSAFGARNRTSTTNAAGRPGLGGAAGGGQRTDRQEIMLQRRLPFTRYTGTVGGLVDSLRKGLGIVMTYEDGMVFISDREKYSVILPQNEEVIQTVTEEIRGLGGEGIVPSLRGGQILYSASPTIQDKVIRPYLDRLARNMAVINVQAAVVSVSLTDNTSTGFDWSKFQVALEGRQSRLNPTTNTTTNNSTTNNGTTNGTGTNGTNGTTPTCATCKVTGSPLDSAGLQQVDPGSVIDLTKNGLVLGKTALGNYFGTYGALSVASAINFLSEFGNTKIDQNVQLKTLSGTDVRFRSGQIVPYVSGVAATSAGYNSNVTGSSATDKVDTGLTVVMTPLYDADTQLVTMNVNLSLKSILQFVQLNAGNQLGTFSQPLVQDQELTDIVRTPAGRTIVIGGLQIDNEQFNGSEPVGLRNIFAQAGTTPDILSSRAQTIKRDALFVILRPSVTVFVPEGR